MLMRCIAPNLWGWLGDATGQRLLIVRVGALLTALTFAGIFWRQDYWWLAAIMALHSFFWHAVLPQFEAITLAHLGSQSSRYSQLRLWGSVGFILTVVLLGMLLQREGMGVYPMAMLGIMLLISLCSALVPAPPEQPAAAQEHADGFLRRLWRRGCSSLFPLCGADAALARAVLHLPEHSPGSAGLWARVDRRALGAWGGCGNPAVSGHASGAGSSVFSLRALLVASFLIASLRWVLLGTLARSFVRADFCPDPARGHLWRLPCSRHSLRSATLWRKVSGTGARRFMRRWRAWAVLWGALYSGYAWQGVGPTLTFGVAALAALAAAVILSLRLREAD